MRKRIPLAARTTVRDRVGHRRYYPDVLPDRAFSSRTAGVRRTVFDGFRDSLVHWFAKYVSVYLWLPVADIFGAVLARIQTLSLQQDMDRMLVDPFYFVDSNNSIYILFMVVGIIGYFTIPSVAGWVVQASGFGAYNRKLNAAGMKAKNLVTGTAGYAWGKTAHLWKSMTAKPPSAASRKS